MKKHTQWETSASPWLVAGTATLLALSACSEKDKVAEKKAAAPAYTQAVASEPPKALERPFMLAANTPQRVAAQNAFSSFSVNAVSR